MKKYLYAIAIATLCLLHLATAHAAPTSTIVPNLKIPNIKNATCLGTDASGLAYDDSANCGGSGTPGTFVTTTINGVTTTTFQLNASSTTSVLSVSTTSPNIITIILDLRNYLTAALLTLNGMSAPNQNVIAGTGMTYSTSTSGNSATTTLTLNINNGSTQTCSSNQFFNQISATGITNCGSITFPASITSINSQTGPAITIQATTNQVNVTSTANTITLSTPQDIATSSKPTFNGITLNGTATTTGIVNTGTVTSTDVVDTSVTSSLYLADSAGKATKYAGSSFSPNSGCVSSVSVSATGSVSGATTTCVTSAITSVNNMTNANANIVAGTGLTQSTSSSGSNSTTTLSLSTPVSVGNGGTGTTTVPAKGSVLVGISSSQYNPLAVGADGNTTSTDILTASSSAASGVAWQSVPLGYDFLGSTVLASAATSTSLSFPARTELLVQVSVTGYGGSDIASFRFNGDSGTHYWSRYLRYGNGTTTAVDSTNVSQTLARLFGGGQTTGRTALVDIANSTSADKFGGLAGPLSGTGSAATAGVVEFGGWEWATTTQITSILMFAAAANNLNAGSGFAVYGKNL